MVPKEQMNRQTRQCQNSGIYIHSRALQSFISNVHSSADPIIIILLHKGTFAKSIQHNLGYSASLFHILQSSTPLLPTTAHPLSLCIQTISTLSDSLSSPTLYSSASTHHFILNAIYSLGITTSNSRSRLAAETPLHG